MRPHYFTLVLLLIYGVSCQSSKPTELGKASPPVLAPFEGLDTLATNDWWNRKQGPILNMLVPRSEVLAFGIYTVSNETLKLSAQLFPLYPEETREVRLEIESDGTWKEIQRQEVNDLGWSALFRVENWNNTKDVTYRILHGDSASFEGLIRKNPTSREISIAALSCNSNKDRGDREDYVRNINFQNPDLVFFAGDQSYDHTEHTAAWLKFGMQFREVFRNRPAVTIPDDHDIGQGNLWGENGRIAPNKDGADGGYFYHHDYVKMVERCQTAHLPDPFDPSPIEQGIGVYYTNLIIGGVDFAIIEDRKFKSGPRNKIPQIGPRADHINDPSYDPSAVDLPELVLLGDRQHVFLEQWGNNNPNGELMKAVLSQTGFCGGAHLHGSKENRLHADMDSNGWPQTQRNMALNLIKKANAIHIAGDQHLATVIKHGMEAYDDGPWAFVVPAIVNDYYSRWWWPEDEQAGKNSNQILPWTGQYLDGFANKITMHAYVNPDSKSNGAGYGLIRFDTQTKDVTFECWARETNITEEGARQFAGWPITVNLQLDKITRQAHTMD